MSHTVWYESYDTYGIILISYNTCSIMCDTFYCAGLLDQLVIYEYKKSYIYQTCIGVGQYTLIFVCVYMYDYCNFSLGFIVFNFTKR